MENNWYEVNYYIVGIGRMIKERVLASSASKAIDLVKRTASVPDRCFGHSAWECGRP